MFDMEFSHGISTYIIGFFHFFFNLKQTYAITWIDLYSLLFRSVATAEIREGFLCPICLHDLGSIADLQEHFEEAHAEEDKAVLQQLKGILKYNYMCIEFNFKGGLLNTIHSIIHLLIRSTV